MNATLKIPSYFSDVLGMGVSEQIFSVRKFSRWGSLALTIIGLVGAAVVFIWTFISVLDKTQQTNLESTVFAPLFFSAMLGLIGVIAFWIFISNRQKAAVLYQSGIAYSDRKGVRTFTWEDIESIKSNVTRRYTNGIYTVTTHQYTIEIEDGDQIVLNDSLEKVEDLMAAIRQRVFPILYQRYSQLYNSGQTVAFGPITLSRTEGITYGRKSYPWEQVASVKIERGYVQISKKGGGLFSGTSLLAANIPNLEVLLAIADQVVGVKITS